MNPAVRRGLRLAGAILCAAVAAGCGGPDRPAAVEKLVIADANQPGFALLYVAQARGYFRDEGLEVTFQPFRIGREALASVIEGKADLATAYQTPVMTRLFEGWTLGVLGTLSSTGRNQSVVARRDRGIAAPADLRGKRIGGAAATSTEYFLYVLLTTEGVQPHETAWVHVDPADAEKALLSGEVDAMAVFSPFQERLQQALGERAVTFHSDAFIDKAMLVGLRERLLARREATERLMRAIVKAQAYVERHDEESLAITVRHLAGTFEEPLVRAAWKHYRHVAQIDHVLQSTLVRQGRWLVATGRALGALPDIPAALMAEPLRRADPDAVTIRFGYRE